MPDAKPLKAGPTGAEQFTTSDTVPAVNLPVMVGDSGSGGTKGAVPAPAAGDAAAGKFLKADGTWATAGGGSSPNVISPAQITADQDNYNPSGWADATLVRLDFNASCRAITGFDTSSIADGEEKTLVNISANWGYIPSEHGDSTAAGRIAGYTDNIVEPFGAVRIGYDGTSSRYRILHNSFNPALLGLTGRGHYHYESAGATNAGNFPSLNTTLTGGANGGIASTTAIPAAWGLSTSSSATGAAGMHYSQSSVTAAAFGSAHLVTFGVMSIDVLSTGTQRFEATFGLTASPNTNTANINNSIGIRYSDNLNSGKFQCFSRDNSGTETTLDSGITVAADTLYQMCVCIDKARSEARFYINNDFAGKITANIPNAVVCGPRFNIIKSVGTSARDIFVHNFGYYAVAY